MAVKNGRLYLNDRLKLTEVGPDLFVTADGEDVAFRGGQLSLGNRLYTRR